MVRLGACWDSRRGSLPLPGSYSGIALSLVTREVFMNQHTYLRAYLAGIAVQTVFLLVVMSAYCVLRYVYDFPVPVQRVIVFPMAVVPILWGLWNVLFVALRSRWQLSIALHGALLPILMARLGLVVASLL